MAKNGTSRTGLYVTLVAVMFFAALWRFTPSDAGFKQTNMWQRAVNPGPLSAAHATLENTCSSCHTPVSGVDPVNCIVCHANDEAVLQRQPTSFHASVSSCKECHLEHRGRQQAPTSMDHQALARIGLRQLRVDEADSENRALYDRLVSLASTRSTPHRHIRATEALLQCTTCHANDDVHIALFGKDCAQCHATDRWTIPEFRHPSPSSRNCAQCHQAPPSHYMMHFKMISARVAGKPHARVDQCFHCHQTTSWNDILRTGWYKHH